MRRDPTLSYLVPMLVLMASQSSRVTADPRLTKVALIIGLIYSWVESSQLVLFKFLITRCQGIEDQKLRRPLGRCTCSQELWTSFKNYNIVKRIEHAYKSLQYDPKAVPSVKSLNFMLLRWFGHVKRRSVAAPVRRCEMIVPPVEEEGGVGRRSVQRKQSERT